MLMKIPKEETSSSLNDQSDTIIVTALLVAANVFVVVLVAGMFQAFVNFIL
jgi:hypothetical protein